VAPASDTPGPRPCHTCTLSRQVCAGHAGRAPADLRCHQRVMQPGCALRRRSARARGDRAARAGHHPGHWRRGALRAGDARAASRPCSAARNHPRRPLWHGPRAWGRARRSGAAAAAAAAAARGALARWRQARRAGRPHGGPGPRAKAGAKRRRRRRCPPLCKRCLMILTPRCSKVCSMLLHKSCTAYVYLRCSLLAARTHHCCSLNCTSNASGLSRGVLQRHSTMS